MYQIRTNAPDGVWETFVTNAGADTIKAAHDAALKAWVLKNNRIGHFHYTYNPVRFIPAQGLAKHNKASNSILSFNTPTKTDEH